MGRQSSIAPSVVIEAVRMRGKASIRTVAETVGESEAEIMEAIGRMDDAPLRTTLSDDNKTVLLEVTDDAA